MINYYDLIFMKVISIDYTLEIMQRQLEFQGYFLNYHYIYSG